MNETIGLSKQLVVLQPLLEWSRGYGRWRLTTGLTSSRPDTRFKCWGFSTPTHGRKLNYPFNILSGLCFHHIQASHKNVWQSCVIWKIADSVTNTNNKHMHTCMYLKVYPYISCAYLLNHFVTNIFMRIEVVM
jgi:hypothetical protein